MAKTTLTFQPARGRACLKDRIYAQLKSAIEAIDIYDPDVDLRLDERKLAVELETSRTPIREALTRLENDGIVRIVPRKGVYIVRRSKDEIVDMIHAWAAVESMAARLATERASDQAIAGLRDKLNGYGPEPTQTDLDEFDGRDVDFHNSIINMSECATLRRMADDLYAHIRGARARLEFNPKGVRASVTEHEAIVDAIESRDGELAERRVRNHALALARHVRDHIELPL
ncbi:MAG: GntR family transcriptional regulator [Rhodospirillales bacterium]